MSPSLPAPSSPTAIRHGTGSAHAKVILLGEHAVVHGAPGIALPVPALRVHVDAREASGPSTLDTALGSGPLDAAPPRLQPTVTALRAVLRRLGAAPDSPVALHVRSDIPVERGLGSSAAVAAATIGAVAAMLGDEIDPVSRHELIQDAERVAHGTPSGLDAHAVVADGPVWFQDGDVHSALVGHPFSFVIADTCSAGRTREAVAAVHAQRTARPSQVDRVVELLGELASGARDDLARGDHAGLGARLDAAHELLQRLEVSSPELDRLVQAARAAGALGAKLTGGGRGGCIIALAPSADDSGGLADALRRSGAAATWITSVEPPP